MSICWETAIRKRKCHICGLLVINKGDEYIRLSSGYQDINKSKNDNYNTGSNICKNCIENIEKLIPKKEVK